MADSARTAFDDVDIASPRSLPPFRAAVSDQPKPKRNLPKKAHATVPTIQLPTNVATWTRMHVKKWLIYTVQVKTVAPKLAAVDGAMLAEWATDTHLDMRLRDAYSITQPVHRLRLATHIRALRPQRAIDTNRREKVDDDKDLYEMPIDVETRSSTSCVQGDAITDSQPMQVASAVEIAPTTQFSSSAPDAPTHADDSVVGKRRVGCVMDETEPCARGGSVGERSNDATGLDKVDDEGDECLPSFSDAFIALEDDGRGSPPPPFDDALPRMEDL
ncbi:hypothetical protein H310_11282 [Aphanomyces invadans]|uniref:Uncharacterized protein n=1 Tax=Aphanomyces invadans TaxID=157072 RepID=A0A024TQ23_9STRA|nr:hypothetical protein H310_11282 [Aphanomyces invadans]ETV95407.1 hypothetical protein H310_11282 [Aphanomyces invadans]|eukprot:XP_008876108.1 hypothetical protein H310_11282 [Aphanomyces invadans]